MKKIMGIALFLINTVTWGMGTYQRYKPDLNMYWRNDEEAALYRENRAALECTFKNMSSEDYGRYRKKLWHDIHDIQEHEKEEGAFVDTSFAVCKVCGENVEEKKNVTTLACGHTLHAVCEQQWCEGVLAHTIGGDDWAGVKCPVKDCNNPYPLNVFMHTQLGLLQEWLDTIRPWTAPQSEESGIDNIPVESVIKKISRGMSYVVAGAAGIALIGYGVWKYRTDTKQRADSFTQIT